MPDSDTLSRAEAQGARFVRKLEWHLGWLNGFTGAAEDRAFDSLCNTLGLDT